MNWISYSYICNPAYTISGGSKVGEGGVRGLGIWKGTHLLISNCLLVLMLDYMFSYWCIPRISLIRIHDTWFKNGIGYFRIYFDSCDTCILRKKSVSTVCRKRFNWGFYPDEKIYHYCQWCNSSPVEVEVLVLSSKYTLTHLILKACCQP